MTVRLPVKTGKKNKNAFKKPLLALAFLFIGPLIYFLFSGIFFGKARNQNLSIQELYFLKNQSSPSLYVKVRNNSPVPRKLTADLFIEDTLNSLKRIINLGDLGEIEQGSEQEYNLSWENAWYGSGIGRINFIVHGQDGLVAEKDLSLVVIPENITSIGLLTTFLASGLIGATLVLSRIV